MTVDRSPHRQNRDLTFHANMGVGRHGWLRLTPAYGVRLVRDRVSRLPEGSIITDPFSGTGTTPLAAAELGHTGHGVDLNPFLIWLGRMKTRHYSSRTLAIAHDECEEVISLAHRHINSEGLWQPAIFQIEKWWSTTRLQALKGIRYGIDERDPMDEVKDLLEISLCRTLIATSNAAFNHQSMSFKDAEEVGALQGPDSATKTLTTFRAEFRTIADSARHDLIGEAGLVHGDSREAIEPNPCDLLLTSPPYVNRMSYIRELRPYMYWLRFLEKADHAGDLDWRAIGGTWGTATTKLKSWEPATETPVDKEILPTCKNISADGGKHGPTLARYVHKYFHDMWLHFQSITSTVKTGGSVSYIVGNSTFYGNMVPTQNWYATMLRNLGYENVAVDVIRKRNSNKVLYEYDVTGIRA